MVVELAYQSGVFVGTTTDHHVGGRDIVLFAETPEDGTIRLPDGVTVRGFKAMLTPKDAESIAASLLLSARAIRARQRGLPSRQ